MKRSHVFVVGVITALAMALTACGGNATSPSGNGVTLNGIALDLPTSAASGPSARSGATASSTSAVITVTVREDPSLTTTISGNGSFKLEGLPPGTITLDFTSDGVLLGTITISDVPSDAEVSIVVRVSKSGVLVVKVEIDGSDETDDQAEKTCLVNGGKVGSGIQLEGSVSAPTSPVGASSFTMAVNGQRSSGLVFVAYSGASFKCAGVKGTCDETLIATGARVHVSGNLRSCSTTEAVVDATQVKFQH